MKLKLLPAICALALIGFSDYSSAANHQRHRGSSKAAKLQAQIDSLQEEVEALKASSSTTKVETGSPITIGPYIGVEPLFNGVDLMVHNPSLKIVNLLKHRKALEDALNDEGLKPADKPRLELSGKVETGISHDQPYTGRSTRDINVGGAELDFFAEVNPWVSGYMSVAFDGDSSDLSISNRRTSNSRLFINEVFGTVGNLNRSPFYATIGQSFMPFGRYNMRTVSVPLTITMARLKERGLVIGYQHESDSGLFASAFAYKPETILSSSSDSKINAGGANLGFDVVTKDMSVQFGGSVISNMADADGFQATGGSTFIGFDNSNVATSENMVRRVPAYSIYANASFGPIDILGEFISGAKRFASEDLTYGSKGAKPKVYDVEAAYNFSIMDHPSSVAIAYAGTKQAVAINLPKHRYTAAVNYSPWKNTILSAEYHYDKDYGASDVGTGNGSANISGTGRSASAAVLQFGIYF